MNIFLRNRQKLLTLFIHISIWIVVILTPHYFLSPPNQDADFIWREFVQWPFTILFFYLNYLFLIPRYLIQNKFRKYFIAIFTIIALTYGTTTIYVNNFDKREKFTRHEKAPFNEDIPQFGKTPPNKFQSPPPFEFAPKRIQHHQGIASAFICLLFLAIGTSIQITQQWYIKESQQKEIKNQQLIAELSFLKAQINPHFFFNTLNSIYSLAIQKSELTQVAIVKLSELMRYVIYESIKERVPIQQELDYIQNFIELQKLRLTDNVKINLLIEGNYNNLMIEPLLFIPLIENAFKHGVNSTSECLINISFHFSDVAIFLQIENPIIEKKSVQSSSGIGLNNVKKRLELYYPQHYQLICNTVDKKHITQLTIQI